MERVGDVAYFETRPDWVCEVLSPTTEQIDPAHKLPIYVREGVGHAWLVNPRQQTLEVLRREGNHWLTVATFEGSAPVCAEPFDAIELELGILWADVNLDTPGT